MTTERNQLELLFATGENKSKKISIKDPVLNLTQEEVEPALQAIVASDIFESEGVDLYAEAKGARYVRTVTEDIYEVEEA